MTVKSAHLRRLPRNRACALYGREPNGQIGIAIEMPPTTQDVVYHGTGGMIEIKDAQVPALYILHQGNQFGINVEWNGHLYAWPGGNVWDGGRVCWGGNTPPHDAIEAYTKFLGSPFNRDLLQLHEPIEADYQAAGCQRPEAPAYLHLLSQSEASDNWMSISDCIVSRSAKIIERLVVVQEYIAKRYLQTHSQRMQVLMNGGASAQDIELVTERCRRLAVISQRIDALRNDLLYPAGWIHNHNIGNRYREWRASRNRQQRTAMRSVPLFGASPYFFRYLRKMMRGRFAGHTAAALLRTYTTLWWYNQYLPRLDRDRAGTVQTMQIKRLWKQGLWPSQVRGTPTDIAWLPKAREIPKVVDWYARFRIHPCIPGHGPLSYNNALQEFGTRDPLVGLYHLLVLKHERKPTWQAWISRVRGQCFLPHRRPQARTMVLGWTLPNGVLEAVADNGLYRGTPDQSPSGYSWERCDPVTKRSRRRKHAIQ